VANKRKIKNMTRVEHKRALERAVGLQTEAMRQMQGQVFRPKLDQRGAKNKGDLYSRTVAAGKSLLQDGHDLPGSRSEMIISYYSRKDVQQAMYNYAKGRKICVLRNFRPMFGNSQLRKPEDLLYIMAFYSQEPKLWPSIHGMASRRNDDGRAVFDLVVEVDFKKSRSKSFSLSRPIVNLLQNLGVDFRMKFSGNASPHIIIPAEAFPEEWRKISKCRSLYGKLLEFFRTQIKSPRTLDGSFRNPNHFLRMPYSLNENTGLVSLPMRVEDFDRFSWESARPESVEIVEDWWTPVAEDAPERTAALIEMAFGQRKVFAVESHAVKPERRALAPQMPVTLGTPVKMGMVKTGEGIAARGVALMEEPLMQEALNELSAVTAGNGHDQAERWRHTGAIAQKHGVGKEDMQLMWQWSEKSGALAYYSRPDVQEAIYSYVQGRCVRMEGTDEYFTLDEPQDVFGLAAYMVGGGVVPTFRCTNAQYDLESGEMTACDMVIETSPAVGKSVALLLRGFDMPSFALYSGDSSLRIVIPFKMLKAGTNFEPLLQKLPELARGLTRHLRRMLRSENGVRVSLHEDVMPILYSIADDGGGVNLPMRLEDVSRLSPDVARSDTVGTLENVDSFMPPDAGEKAARFFNELIL